MKIAIFGSGPSGLIAAHAVASLGYATPWEVDIFSKGDKSPLYGCQYLHQPLPAIDCGEGVTVKYELVGTPELYHRKVYGEQRVSSVSPEEYGGEHQAWDIRYVYDQLWDAWFGRIKTGIIDHPGEDSVFEYILGSYDKVISTIPRKAWCVNEEQHKFSVSEIYALGDAPDIGVRTPFRNNLDNSVVCNSLSDVGWYRMSRVFDFNTIEWPGEKKPPVARIAKVMKPLSTNCDCYAKTDDDVSWGERILFVGRYGEWKKGVLAHEVYNQVRDAFA
jgi:hypothetical protein